MMQPGTRWIMTRAALQIAARPCRGAGRRVALATARSPRCDGCRSWKCVAEHCCCYIATAVLHRLYATDADFAPADLSALTATLLDIIQHDSCNIGVMVGRWLFDTVDSTRSELQAAWCKFLAKVLHNSRRALKRAPGFSIAWRPLYTLLCNVPAMVMSTAVGTFVEVFVCGVLGGCLWC